MRYTYRVRGSITPEVKEALDARYGVGKWDHRPDPPYTPMKDNPAAMAEEELIKQGIVKRPEAIKSYAQAEIGFVTDTMLGEAVGNFAAVSRLVLP